MSMIDFIKKLYNGKNCYSDHMNYDDLNRLHIPSHVEDIIISLLKKGKIIFLTGNPGDGKTFIIKSIENSIRNINAYIETDLSQISDYAIVANSIINCYQDGRPALLAVNEYPFHQLCKSIREISLSVYDEIVDVRKKSVVYDIPEGRLKKIVIIDLNERSLLGHDRSLADNLLTQICELLSSDEHIGKVLKYNLQAMNNPMIRAQLLKLFDLAVVSGEHFAVRDILGAFSFILTACESDEYKDIPYYEAAFAGSNSLLKEIQIFDPIFLSKPSLDEQIWNGEILTGWEINVPEKWPCSSEFNDSVDEAMNLFQSIKRKFYFENIGGSELARLQPSEISNCTELFINLESERRSCTEKIVKGINKLFLPSSTNKKELRIWSTHRYTMSDEASVAVSSRFISTSNLELLMPRLADWLTGVEYMPSHLILKPKGKDFPVLKIDIDFLRTINAINEGYPVNLLAPNYVQATSIFLQKLYEEGLTEEYEYGEIIIANRKMSYKKSVFIEDGKYKFEGEDE